MTLNETRIRLTTDLFCSLNIKKKKIEKFLTTKDEISLITRLKSFYKMILMSLKEDHFCENAFEHQNRLVKLKERLSIKSNVKTIYYKSFSVRTIDRELGEKYERRC